MRKRITTFNITLDAEDQIFEYEFIADFNASKQFDLLTDDEIRQYKNEIICRLKFCLMQENYLQYTMNE